LVLVSARLDIILGTAYIRHGVCVAFMVNELISIVENLGLLGIRLPAVLVNAIEILQKKTETTEIKEDDE
jgi:toxin secretion/phage lysis holin